uniref:Phage-like element PBSX protein XkdF domain-containing protein n=1 Tax=Dictyoglomus turgidum TaxID=513050 RepID=A0A7C3WW99_9BACT
MLKNELKFYIPIQKIDKEQRMVYGYATTDAEDSQGEIVEIDAVKDAWDDYWKWANIREMHQLSAVGVGKEYQFDDKGVWIGAKIVDDNAWKKVKEGVYKGFSIGGRTLEKKENRIKKLEIDEISIVDRPANPEAVFTIIKRYDKKSENLLLKVGSLIDKIKNQKNKMEKELEKYRRKTDSKEEESNVSEEQSATSESAEKPTEEKPTVENKEFGTVPREQATVSNIVYKQDDEEDNQDNEENDQENDQELDDDLEEEAIKEFASNLSLLVEILEKKNASSKKIGVLKQILDLLRQLEEGNFDGENPDEGMTSEEKVMKVIKTELSGITQKVVDSLAKVETDILSLKERVEKLERQPRGNRPVASYLIEKGEKEEAKSADTIKKELAEIEEEIEKIHNEGMVLLSNPDPVKQGELERKLRDIEKRYNEKKLELRKVVYGI